MSADQHIFAIMPVDVFGDARLSKTDLRVLGAILSFRNRETNLCWPSRAQIARITGLTERKISAATARLETFGWLFKKGGGGRGKAVCYEFRMVPLEQEETVSEVIVPSVESPVDNRGTPPETLPESGTVSALKRMPEQGRVSGERVPEQGRVSEKNPAQFGPKTLPKSGTPTDQGTNQALRCAMRARAREDGGVEHPAELVATLAELGFRAEQVHTPKVMAMLRRWQSAGVTPDTLRQLVTTLRARAPNREFGPAYLDAPMHDYLEALSHAQTDTGSTTRTAGHRPRTKAEMFWDNIRPGLETPWDAQVEWE